MVAQVGPEAVPGHRRSLLQTYLPMVSVIAVVIAVDQLTKWWALGLQPCSASPDRPIVEFCLAHNEGMAFSLGWGAGPTIAVIVIAVIGIALVSASRVSAPTRLLLGLIIGGAIGNLIDRALRSPAPGSSSAGAMSGAVVDFVGTSFFATFNVADAAVVIGGFSLAIVLWRRPDPEPQDPAGET